LLHLGEVRAARKAQAPLEQFKASASTKMSDAAYRSPEQRGVGVTDLAGGAAQQLHELGHVSRSGVRDRLDRAVAT
jgi:hypothetical protein